MSFESGTIPDIIYGYGRFAIVTGGLINTKSFDQTNMRLLFGTIYNKEVELFAF